MVHLSEVTDEHFEEIPPSTSNPSDNDDDDFEDYSTDSSLSDSNPDPLLRPAHRHRHHHHHHNRSRRRTGPSASSARKTRATTTAAAADVDSDSESDSDSDSDDGISFEESIYDRLVALKDIIPIKQRAAISGVVGGTVGWVTWGAKMGGKVMYVVTTAALLVGVPWALAVAEEGGIVEMERDMKLQQSANELITLGGGGGAGSGGAAALSAALGGAGSGVGQGGLRI